METGVHYRVQKYNQTNPTRNQLILISDLFQYFHPLSPIVNCLGFLAKLQSEFLIPTSVPLISFYIN